MARLAFVSTAHIHAKPFIEGIARATDGRGLHAVWDDVPARGQRHADLGRARFEPDLTALLHDPAVDGFVLCAENTRHRPLLPALLATGKPVLVEKPLVTSADEAWAVGELVRARRARLCCGYFLPFSPEMTAVRAMLARGEFGKITRIRFRNSHAGAYWRLFDPADLRWFTEPALAGGGAFMDVGAHAVHLACSLFGPVEQAWADIGNHSGIYPTCDDYGIAHLRFASGVLGTIEAAWTETGGENGLEIVGSEKSLWKVGRNYVTGVHGRGEPQPLEPGEARPAQIDRLVAMIRGELTNAELEADLVACVEEVAVMEACYAAAKTGQWMPVPRVGRPVTAPIAIEGYRPEWPEEFETIRSSLQQILGGQARRIDHIGSTAVPGLGAKDIIDIQITVPALTAEVAARLSAAGFDYRPQVNRDHVPEGEDPAPEFWLKQFFRQPSGHRRANVHVRVEGRPNQRYALLFRDYLRAHPPAARSIDLIKREIANHHAHDEEAYYDLKDPVYDLIWAAAKDWAKETGWQP